MITSLIIVLFQNESKDEPTKDPSQSRESSASRGDDSEELECWICYDTDRLVSPGWYYRGSGDLRVKLNCLFGIIYVVIY